MPHILISSPCHSTNPLQVAVKYAANLYFFLLTHSGIFTIIVYVVIEVAAYLHFFLLAHSCSLLTLMCTFKHTFRSHVCLVWCFLAPLFSWSPVFFVAYFLRLLFSSVNHLKKFHRPRPSPRTSSCHGVVRLEGIRRDAVLQE
jgi:hypothetical protein